MRVELHEHHADDGCPLRDLVGDAEQLLDAETVGRLVEDRRQVVHPRDGVTPCVQVRNSMFFSMPVCR